MFRESEKQQNENLFLIRLAALSHLDENYHREMFEYRECDPNTKQSSISFASWHRGELAL